MNMGRGVRFLGIWLFAGLVAVANNNAFAAELSIATPVQTICTGETAEFTANLTGGTPPYTFSWSGPNYFSTNSQTISVGAVGNYSVSVSDAAGAHYGPVCATLNLKERPSLRTADGKLNCASTQIRLSAFTSASNAVFSWTGPGIVSGGDTANPYVNLPGNYSVTVTALNGCSSSTNVVVTEDREPPQVTIPVPEVLSCTKPQVLLTALSTNRFLDYTWSGPGIVAGTNSATCTVDQPGLYTVTFALAIRRSSLTPCRQTPVSS